MPRTYRCAVYFALLSYLLTPVACSNSSDGASSPDSGGAHDAQSATPEPDAASIGDTADAAALDSAPSASRTCVENEYTSEPICTAACIIDGDLRIEDRADLEAVAKSGCDVVRGGLIVEETDLTDLEGLEKLRVVTGWVIIAGNEQLVTIRALEGLERFGGALYVRDNARLASLDGFGSLSAEPGYFMTDIRIERNAALADVDGLAGVESATFLWLRDNASLVDVSGLRSLRGVGWLSIANNDSLVDLRGLESLERVWGQCHSSNAGGLYVSDNERLESLAGLEGLRAVSFGLSISSNPSLTDISALEGLTEVGACPYGPGYMIADNDSLESLDGFAAGDGGNVVISGNDSLTDIEALSVLTNPFVLTIADNDSLTDLDGLENVASVGYRTGGRPSTRVQGGLRIMGNDALTNVDALRALGAAPDHRGFIYVEDNPALLDLYGLAHLQSAGLLSVRNNDRLEALDGLEQLRRVDRRLSIENNDALETLSGLAELESVGGLFVVDNPRVPSCEAEALLAQVDLLTGREVAIEGNDDGASCE